MAILQLDLESVLDFSFCGFIIAAMRFCVGLPIYPMFFTLPHCCKVQCTCTVCVCVCVCVCVRCRRDALNFSHHRTTPKGVFDMVSLCHCESLYIARISSLFIGSSTNQVLVAASRFPQTMLCLSPRRDITLLIHVTS